MKYIKTKDNAKIGDRRISAPDFHYIMRKELIKRSPSDYDPNDSDDFVSEGENRTEDLTDEAASQIVGAAGRTVNNVKTRGSARRSGSSMAYTSVPSFDANEAVDPIRPGSDSVESSRKLFAKRRAKETFNRASGRTDRRMTAITEWIKSMITHPLKESASDLYLRLAAGGSILLILIILICTIGLAVGSSFGIFFSGEDTGTGLSVRSVIQDINAEYGARIQVIKAQYPYDYLDMSGSTAPWREVLSVYAVKLNTDSSDPMDAVSMDERKADYLRDIFWEMNNIDAYIDTVVEPIQNETMDVEEDPLIEPENVEKLMLHISISHVTAEEMADLYGFDVVQRGSLMQLLDDKNASLWAALMYGVQTGSEAIVEVAKTQIGCVGGEPYWSWYGFASRVEWCSCFVSWCANECGLIDSGMFPMHADPQVAVNWYKANDKWLPGSFEPATGMLIFFDWDNKGSAGDQNGYADHIGIVEKTEDGYVHTIEGNTADSVARRQYRVGHYEIMGYGQF